MKPVKIEASLEIEGGKATTQGITLMLMVDAKNQINPKETAFGLLKITEDGKSIEQYPCSSLAKGKSLVLDFGSATGSDSKETALNPLGDRYYQLDFPEKPLALGQVWTLRGGEDRLTYKVSTITGLEPAKK